MVRHVSFHRQLIALLGFSFAPRRYFLCGQAARISGAGGVGGAKGQLVRGGTRRVPEMAVLGAGEKIIIFEM